MSATTTSSDPFAPQGPAAVEMTENTEEYLESSSGKAPETPANSAEDSAAEVRSPRAFWKRALLGSAVAAPIAVGGLWYAVHTFDWMGPLVANTLRATIGKKNVTELEDFVYSVEDRVYKVTRSGEAPKSYWDVEAQRVSPAIATPPPRRTKPILVSAEQLLKRLQKKPKKS